MRDPLHPGQAFNDWTTTPSLGRKEMFYLTTHSTHFIYGYMASDIWLMTILIVREETCCRHIGYSFRLAARVLLHVQDKIAHTTAVVTPVVEHWLEREIAQWVHHEGSIRRPIAPRANALTTEIYLALQYRKLKQSERHIAPWASD